VLTAGSISTTSGSLTCSASVKRWATCPASTEVGCGGSWIAYEAPALSDMRIHQHRPENRGERRV